MIVPFRPTRDRKRDTPVQSTIWYRAFLSGEQVASGALAELCEQFAIAVRRAGETEGACLFAITDAGGGDEGGNAEADGTTALYFSPRAISLIPLLLVTSKARPCDAPPRLNATLLVGRPADWNLLPCTTH